KSTQINYDVKELLDMFREGMKLLDSTEVQNQSVNQKTAATATARRQTSKDNINKFIDSNQTLAKIRERNAVKGLLAQWEKTAGAPKPTTPGPLAAAAGSTPTKRVEQSPVRQSSTDCMAFDEDDEDEEYVPIEIVYLEKLLQLHEDLT